MLIVTIYVPLNVQLAIIHPTNCINLKKHLVIRTSPLTFDTVIILKYSTNYSRTLPG